MSDGRYDYHMKHTSDRGDIALANELLSSGVAKSRVMQIFQDRIHEDDLDSIADESRGDYDSSRLDAVAGDIKKLVEEAEAPEDFLDPLYQQLMKGRSSEYHGIFLCNTLYHSQPFLTHLI